MTAQNVAGSKLIKKHMALVSRSLKREIIYEGLQPHFSMNSIIFVVSGLPSWPQNPFIIPICSSLNSCFPQRSIYCFIMSKSGLPLLPQHCCIMSFMIRLLRVQVSMLSLCAVSFRETIRKFPYERRIDPSLCSVTARRGAALASHSDRIRRPENPSIV